MSLDLVGVQITSGSVTALYSICRAKARRENPSCAFPCWAFGDSYGLTVMSKTATQHSDLNPIVIKQHYGDNRFGGFSPLPRDSPS